MMMNSDEQLHEVLDEDGQLQLQSDSEGRSSCDSSDGGSSLEDDNRIRLAVYNLHKQIRIYHVGVEVRGKEFHYGIKIGLFTVPPQNGGKNFHVTHFNRFRWRIEYMHTKDILVNKRPVYTDMTLEQLLEVQEELRPKYRWADYNVIGHNCMDYAMEFVRRISAVKLPEKKFFAWRQEMRQPLIALPLRVVVRTEAWRKVMRMIIDEQDETKQKVKRTKKKKKRGNSTSGEERQQTQSKLRRDNALPADQSVQCGEKTIESAAAPTTHPLYITIIEILPIEEGNGTKKCPETT